MSLTKYLHTFPGRKVWQTMFPKEVKRSILLVTDWKTFSCTSLHQSQAKLAPKKPQNMPSNKSLLIVIITNPVKFSPSYNPRANIINLNFEI